MSTWAAAAQVSLTRWLASVIAVAVVVSAVLSLLAVRYATREAQRTREEALTAAAEARQEAARERRLQYERGREDVREHAQLGALGHTGPPVRCPSGQAGYWSCRA